MTEEQKKRIRHVELGECCDFDGLPMHPHYYYYLTCSGFNNLTEIEEKTEAEFVEIVNNSINLHRSSHNTLLRLYYLSHNRDNTFLFLTFCLGSYNTVGEHSSPLQIWLPLEGKLSTARLTDEVVN